MDNLYQFVYLLDLRIFRWANNWAFWKPWIDSLIIFRAEFLGYWMAAGLLAFGVATLPPFSSIFPSFRPFRRGNWELVVMAFIGSAIARFGVAEIIRFFYHRPRPFEVLADVRQLVFHNGASSFPSGHATFYFALAAVVGRYYPKTSILFYLAALNLSLARVQAGIHWPSDVIAGAIIGIAVGLITVSLARKYFKLRTA